MSTRDMVFVALFAALTAAFAVFPPFPAGFLPVPIIVQNMAVMLAGGILGARRGGAALALFVALVAVGLPLLSGGKGGFGVIVGPTGGFVLSWIVAAYVVGRMVEAWWSELDFWHVFAANVIGGIIVVYAIGILWLSVVANIDIGKAFTGSLIFIPGDLVKAVVAAVIVLAVKRAYPLIRP
jgi:biotin transport system substrate-specific component